MAEVRASAVEVPLGPDDEPTEPSRPVLLVPGIGGTMLHIRDQGSSDEGQRVWVTVKDADAQYQRLWGKFNISTSMVDLLLPNLEVYVPPGQDDDSGLYPISVLDPDAALVVGGVHYFDAFIKHLEGQGYTAGKDLFGFGYDFRQSCMSHCQALLEKLRDVSKRNDGRKVDIVTHSMGGLVVRSLLAQQPREFGTLVNTWVAIGCPFGGAPGFGVDALFTGVQWAGSLGSYFFVARTTFRQACLQSPSVFELLPPLDFPYKKPPPQVRMWLSKPIPSDPSSSSSSSEGEEPQPPLSGLQGQTAGLEQSIFFQQPASQLLELFGRLAQSFSMNADGEPELLPASGASPPRQQRQQQEQQQWHGVGPEAGGGGGGSSGSTVGWGSFFGKKKSARPLWVMPPIASASGVPASPGAGGSVPASAAGLPTGVEGTLGGPSVHTGAGSSSPSGACSSAAIHGRSSGAPSSSDLGLAIGGGGGNGDVDGSGVGVDAPPQSALVSDVSRAGLPPPNSATEYVFKHSDLPGLLGKVLQGNSVTLEDQDYPLPFSHAAWDHAQGTHKAWKGIKLPEGCRFYNLYGTGMSTPYDVQYGSSWFPVKAMEELLHANATFSYVDGDKTVPSESATADELEATERVGIKADHRGLIGVSEAWEQVGKWLKDGQQEEADDAWVLVPKTPAAAAEQQPQ